MPPKVTLNYVSVADVSDCDPRFRGGYLQKMQGLGIPWGQTLFNMWLQMPPSMPAYRLFVCWYFLFSVVLLLFLMFFCRPNGSPRRGQDLLALRIGNRAPLDRGEVPQQRDRFSDVGAPVERTVFEATSWAIVVHVHDI